MADETGEGTARGAPAFRMRPPAAPAPFPTASLAVQHPANQADRKSKMSCTVTLPEPL